MDLARFEKNASNSYQAQELYGGTLECGRGEKRGGRGEGRVAQKNFGGGPGPPGPPSGYVPGSPANFSSGIDT